MDGREGDSRGKELRKVGFALAQEPYGECSSSLIFKSLPHKKRADAMSIDAYKPLLAELEKVLAEAGLNE